MLGRATWGQFQLETMTISIVVVYAPSNSARTRAYLWHQLKGVLPDGQWVILGDFNMTKKPSQLLKSIPTLERPTKGGMETH